MAAGTSHTIGTERQREREPRRERATGGEARASLIAEVDAAVRAVLHGGAGSAQPVDRALPVFSGQLFALRHAQALPQTTAEVLVAPGTVVTPLAREHLKRRGIALKLAAAREGTGRKPGGSWGVAVEPAVESGMVAAFRRGLLDDDWTELKGSLDAAAQWVAEAPERGALVLTDEASLAVWRACRVSGVRAATAGEPEGVDRAVRRLGVNLLVVEPLGKSISLFKSMAQAFRRAGVPVPPAGLQIVPEAGKECRCGSPR